MSNILLSICIPTKDRIEILKNTLDSIFSQVEDFSEFEVVISDNSITNELPELLKQYSNIPNIVYQKNDVPGFMNSINALRMGQGELLKLHNDYTELKKGSLNRMLDIIKKNKFKRPLLFFSDSSLNDISVAEYTNFNDFMYTISYFSTWSTCFCIWKYDFNLLSNIEYDNMFPHTSLLLEQSDKESYIVNNEDLFYNQATPGKGGVNLFHNFCVLYLNMLAGCLEKKVIHKRTFNHIKEHMFLSFLIPWYYNTKIKKNNFTYDMTGIKSSLNVYYPSHYYYRLLIRAWFGFFLKRIFRWVLNLFDIRKTQLFKSKITVE
jgi:glycosyltransferase involved in cell wall biosynthesis